MTSSSNAALRRTLDAVWRIESANVIGALTRMLRDVGMAEEIAQDALVVALEQWPRIGVPDNPGAWLMTTAKHRAIDRLRRAQLITRKHTEIGHEIERGESDRPDADAAFDDDIGDDALRLIFVACHPLLSMDARIALTLRLVGGLGTDEIARAFLTSEPTIAQRIVRAKRTLSDANVPFEVPRGDQLIERIDAVLAVLYLIFNEGYSATAGDDWLRPALCEEALRLGRMLAELASEIAEVHGLVALMEIQSSRNRVRTDHHGDPVLLADQDRSRWDPLLIRRGLAALARADRTGNGGRGAYTLQAAIAACHSRASSVGDTDWHAIAALYRELGAIAPSPVVELNRAVAVSMTSGPAAALTIVDALEAGGALAVYHWLPAARGDFLFRLGRMDEARAEFLRAAGITRNQRERDLLQARAGNCASDPGSPD